MKVSKSSVYVMIGLIHLIYLYIGLSESRLQELVFFYLFLMDGGIFTAFLLFRDEAIEKLHLDKVSMMSLAMGVIIGEMLVMIELGFYGALSYKIPFIPSEAVKGYVYLIFVAFVVGNSEEMFFRGFLPAIAEAYHKDAGDLRISKYLLIPSIFGLAHYFAWSSSVFNNPMYSAYMFLYHFSFAVAMQFLEDYYGNLYAPILTHTIYDATKMLMAL